MLKRNLVKTGFLGHGLLLFTPNLNQVKSEPVRQAQQTYTVQQSDTTIVQLATDTSFAFAAAAEDKKEEVTLPEISLHKQAKAYLHGFLKREEEALQLVKLRSNARFRLVDSVFRSYGLPGELKYLAVVESYMKSDALSRVGAKGMWQLMPQTARELGLKVSKKYDERTYVLKSTVAAARYLRSLYAEFGDWLLVMAAYNGGPGTVYKAIKRSGSRNFWALQRFLPEESRGHVKRYIGTHYYFEGAGGLTTMTKSETAAYYKSVADLVKSRNAEKRDNDSIPAIIAVNYLLVADRK
jgi:membrane-bound lytic murein transglycosylase D